MRLLCEPRDQVHADVAKTGFAQTSRRCENVRATMHAAGGLQFAVSEGLHAEADAIESGSEPGLRFFGGDGFGVGFESDFGQSRACVQWPRCNRIARRSIRECKAAAQRLQNSRERGRLEQAGSAATEVDGVHLRVAQGGNFCARRQLRDFPAHRSGVRRIFFARHYAGMKIAIGALCLAERHLNVNAEVHLGAATTSKSSDFTCCTNLPSLIASQCAPTSSMLTSL